MSLHSDLPGILHLIWWEGASSSGLIENQFYKPLRHMAEAHPEYRWLLYSAGPFLKVGVRDWLLRCPWVARFIPNAHIRNRMDTDVLRADLKAHNITLFLRETWVAPRTIYLQWPLQVLFPWLHLVNLGRTLCRHNARIVHCRSYSAAWMALMTRRWTRARFLLVFDMRGLVPEEGVLQGVYGRESGSFRRWKKMEKMLLDESDLIIAPSDTFAEHVATLTSNPRIQTLYTHSPVDLLGETPADKSWLEKFPILKGKPILVYLGALGPQGWHSIEYLVLQFAAFRQAMGSAALLLITQSDSQWVRQKLAEAGIPGDQYVLTGTHGSHETAGLLKLARYGALPYRPVTGPEERLIGHTMIASKTGEYLAAGLPLICHPGIGSAARMVREHGIGCLYDRSIPAESFQKMLASMEKDYAACQKRCVQAASRFDVNRNVERCVQWYAELLKES